MVRLRIRPLFPRENSVLTLGTGDLGVPRAGLDPLKMRKSLNILNNLKESYSP